MASRNLPEPSSLNTVRTIWAAVDDVHSHTQRLQQLLASTSGTPEGCREEERGLDDFILLAVRLDLHIIDLCNCLHAFLGRQTVVDADEELTAMRRESEARCRKCLKLVAYVGPTCDPLQKTH